MNKQILIIDDSPHKRQQLRNQLDDRFQVIEADNGKDGLRLFSEIKPDGVFLDLKMPTLDGRIVLQQLHAKNPKSPIVIMDHNVLDCTRQECILLGATALIDKSFDATRIKKTCDQLFI